MNSSRPLKYVPYNRRSLITYGAVDQGLEIFWLTLTQKYVSESDILGPNVYLSDIEN